MKHLKGRDFEKIMKSVVYQKKTKKPPFFAKKGTSFFFNISSASIKETLQ